ncbi:MAG: hypothetical protein ACTSVZ_14425 [Promethearchaeota archaeon]
MNNPIWPFCGQVGNSKTLLNFEIPESKIKIEAGALQNFAAAIGDMKGIYYDYI